MWEQMILRKKKIIPKRKYHDGDTIQFDFKPGSIDIDSQEVTLVGVVSGVLYEDNGIHYKIQLRDNKREIFGDIIVPEDMIKGKIE